MIKSTHTAGPWTFDGPDHSTIVWSGPDDRVCFMASSGPVEANARLIAAAPELLEALTDILAFKDRPATRFKDEAEVNAMGDAMWAKARAAVAKATGKAPLP